MRKPNAKHESAKDASGAPAACQKWKFPPCWPALPPPRCSAPTMPREGVILTRIAVDGCVWFAGKRRVDLSLCRLGNKFVLLGEVHQQRRMGVVDLPDTSRCRRRDRRPRRRRRSARPSGRSSARDGPSGMRVDKLVIAGVPACSMSRSAMSAYVDCSRLECEKSGHPLRHASRSIRPHAESLQISP